MFAASPRLADFVCKILDNIRIVATAKSEDKDLGMQKSKEIYAAGQFATFIEENVANNLMPREVPFYFHFNII
jgi:hypothetical protein